VAEPRWEEAERAFAIVRAIEHCPRRDGRAIEPLRHHRWYRSDATFRRRPAEGGIHER